MKIIQLASQGTSQMMGYILQADDGTLCCIDGGTNQDTEHMLEILRLLGGEKPHIRYWFFTHAHHDHCSVFLNLWPRRDADFTLDDVVYTFPASEDILTHDPRTGDIPARFEALDIPHILPTVGDTFALGGGAVMEILLTWDPAETANMTNNSSTVYRLTANGMTTVFLGDLGIEGGKRLLAAHGGQLKCDMVQMAHHGQNGVSREVYAELNPDVCLWSTPSWLWSNTLDPLHPNKGPWATLITRGWMQELGDRQRHVVAQYGTWEIQLHDGQADMKLLDRKTGDRL